MRPTGKTALSNSGKLASGSDGTEDAGTGCSCVADDEDAEVDESDEEEAERIGASDDADEDVGVTDEASEEDPSPEEGDGPSAGDSLVSPDVSKAVSTAAAGRKISRLGDDAAEEEVADDETITGRGGAKAMFLSRKCARKWPGAGQA